MNDKKYEVAMFIIEHHEQFAEETTEAAIAFLSAMFAGVGKLEKPQLNPRPQLAPDLRNAEKLLASIDRDIDAIKAKPAPKRNTKKRRKKK